MKNSQRGFAPLVILIVIAAAAIGGGTYYVSTKVDSKNDSTNAKVSQNVDQKNGSSTDTANNIKDASGSPKNSTTTSVIVTPKSSPRPISSNAASVSQNALDLPEAESNLIKIAAVYKERDIESGTYLAVVAPTHSNVLEPGKPASVLFSSVKNASKYEISIVMPSWVDKTQGLVSADKVDTLLKEVTTKTRLDIIVPQTNAQLLSENSYNGEQLWVRALDAGGKEIISQRVQIRILPPADDPHLLKADRYVVGKDGGTVTITFGALPAHLKTRKVSISCVNGYSVASIDGKSCEEPLMLGVGPYTKKLIIKPNIFKDRETAIDFRVQYYDANGKEPNSQSLEDESFISIKINRF